MKTKFDNRQCAHVWAQLSQPFGESASMHFDGAVLYSYQTPIGRFYSHGRAGTQRVVLVSEESYSATTAGKHLPALFRALRSEDIWFRVPHVLVDGVSNYTKGTTYGRAVVGTHADNLAYLAKQLQLEYNRLRRARVADYAALHTLKAKARQYAEIFGLPDPGCDSVEAERSIRLERTVKLERSNTPAKIAARARADAKKAALKAERDAKIAAANGDRVKLWLAGENVYLQHYGAVDTLLRIKGDEVQTSRGASVPVADARRVIPLIRKIAARGKNADYDTTTEVFMVLSVGHFTVDTIYANGDIQAGCHFIKAAEINRIALELGL